MARSTVIITPTDEMGIIGSHTVLRGTKERVVKLQREMTPLEQFVIDGGVSCDRSCLLVEQLLAFAPFR